MEIICTYDEYDRFEEVFHQMDYQAGEYVPDTVELEEEILPNLKKYITFLMWIDTTGVQNEENRYVRKLIHNILLKNITLVDELPEKCQEVKKGKKS